jgi:hypothetical protein
MLDEQAYKQTYRAVSPLACPFEKAALNCQWPCREAQRVNIAERIAVSCKDGQAQGECIQLIGLLRRNAAFALKLTHPDEVLPHAKDVKVQCGGLLGLQEALRDKPAGTLLQEDIRAMVQEAGERFGGLEALPYSEIVRGIAGFQTRKRSTR